jgi:hypothetical protein
VIPVVLTALIFSIAYVPMTFIAIQMFDKLKLSLVFRIACAVSILGGWIRVIEV